MADRRGRDEGWAPPRFLTVPGMLLLVVVAALVMAIVIGAIFAFSGRVPATDRRGGLLGADAISVGTP